ncbi:hypothetical protein VBD025_15100 [Virgibacillus flavescens]|uniref:hypothetical protein n=1 Tax=Virgibacillus flavescens TaxID=1611422 RepID=UPI003D3291B0
MNGGTFRLVYEDARATFGKVILLYLTIPLFFLWLSIGYFFPLGGDVVAAISGPAYFFISFFSITGFKTMYPVAIGMGSTRTSLLKAYYVVGLASVLIVTFVLNILQLLLVTFYERWDVAAKILHPAIFILDEYSFLSYFLLDLLFITIIFSISFLLFTIYYRLGFMKSIVWLMVLIIIGTLLKYSGLVSFSLFSWITGQDINGTVLYSSLLFISLVALFITYPIMRNASLQAKPRKS